MDLRNDIRKILAQEGKKKKPFTKEEQEVMDLLVEAHNKYTELEQTHPSDLPDWVNALHTLQRLLGQRILRRDYPEDFPTHK